MPNEFGGKDHIQAIALRYLRGKGLIRFLLAAILVVLMASGSAGTNAQVGAPALELEYEVTPAVVSTVSDELTVEITVAGKGGRAGDLPLEIRENLPRRPLEVVLVLDRSGSMEYDDYRPTRLEAAKDAARTFLEQIQAGDSTALVSFSDFATLDVPLTEDRGLSLEYLGGLWPDGGTAIGEGLYTAIDVLEGGAAESVKAIVLLSDGVSNEGRDPRHAADAARNAGIPVFTVGIGTPGDEFDEPTLRHIAEVTGGEYLYAPDEEELSRVYERMGGKVINVAGVNATLEIEVGGLFDLDRYATEDLRSSRGGRLVYHWDQIPVGEQKTVQLQLWPLATPVEGSAAAINSIKLTYQSLGSDRVRTVFAGPVEVEFESNLERGTLKIDRISFERTLDAYPDSNVYSQNDDIRVGIHLDRRPRGEIVSRAWAQHGRSSSEVSRELSDDDVISHRFEHSGYVGRYTLTGTAEQEPGRIFDHLEEDFFVVFDPPREFQNFSQSQVIVGDEEGWWGYSLRPTRLHPRDPRIMEAMASLLSEQYQRPVSGWWPCWQHQTDPTTPMATAEFIACNMSLYTLNPNENNADHPSDLDILNAGEGDCTDMIALYASMMRSLNIPVRGVTMEWRMRKDIPWSWVNLGEQGGHAFTEVYIDGDWIHADPTHRNFDFADSYLRNYRALKIRVETSPGVLDYDRSTALKYSVGLFYWPNVIEIDLEQSQEERVDLKFTNATDEESPLLFRGSGEPKARGVSIRVIEDAGLDIGRTSLKNGPVLDPGEIDAADLDISVPDDVVRDVPAGGERTLNLRLELRFEDGEGGMITKSYPMEIRLKRPS